MTNSNGASAADDGWQDVFKEAGIDPRLFVLAKQSEALVDTMSDVFRRIDARWITQFRSIYDAIGEAKAEIRSIRPLEMATHRLPTATSEMDAITVDTELATHTILASAETIMGLSSTDAATKAAVDDEIMKIFEACTFQDLTGQRVSKIVGLLSQIEGRITKLVDTLGVHDGEDHEPVSAEEQRRRDLLLNGPAVGGPETNQAAIDALFD
ncbi:protein phosphatase CheZ [Asticcacaulis solisilvae]|uniref:protein phosphatase CheZ n=1 Tax=Asticcacaulis solisilvae TaxID=1217274 RepID=UPI003FD8A74B